MTGILLSRSSCGLYHRTAPGNMFTKAEKEFIEGVISPAVKPMYKLSMTIFLSVMSIDFSAAGFLRPPNSGLCIFGRTFSIVSFIYKCPILLPAFQFVLWENAVS